MSFQQVAKDQVSPNATPAPAVGVSVGTVHSDRAAGVQKLNTSPDATVTTDLGHLSNEWTPATDATVTTDDTHCNTLANPYSSRTNSNAPSPPSEKGPGALPF